uniref:Secreted protein n=1 Tax=Schistosoma curassoni TaxID=6186 RepID=A0A183KJT6_9TREM
MSARASHSGFPVSSVSNSASQFVSARTRSPTFLRILARSSNGKSIHCFCALQALIAISSSCEYVVCLEPKVAKWTDHN